MRSVRITLRYEDTAGPDIEVATHVVLSDTASDREYVEKAVGFAVRSLFEKGPGR